ncbi:ABC transporter permease [Streptomyces sp. NPDC058642]|uniref:ABC transporter permease n=1 Tax=Streptomyces sp. NPDC058642 TaxID=3346572 RepID=UPI00365C4746
MDTGAPGDRGDGMSGGRETGDRQEGVRAADGGSVSPGGAARPGGPPGSARPAPGSTRPSRRHGTAEARPSKAAQRGRLPTGLRHALLRWLVLAVAVALWEVSARAHGSVYFPPPGRIARHAHELWFSGPVRHAFLSEAAVADILPSLGRMGAGFGLAAVAGIALGVAVGRSRRAYALCNPVLQFARAVPPPALVPVFVVVLDFGTPMQIASIAFSAVWPVLINTAEGARNTDPLRLDVAAVLRLNPVERLCFLILPSALPRIFAGLRLSLSLSLILMVFSELLPGTANGIGFTLTDAQTRSDLLTVWAALVLLGALGYLLNTGLLAVEKRLVGSGRTTA